MCFAQITIDERIVGHRWPAGGSRVHQTLPGPLGRAECFGHQVITRAEVLVEAANGQTGLLHQLGDSDPGKPLFAEPLRSESNDALVSFRFFSAGMAHSISPKK